MKHFSTLLLILFTNLLVAQKADFPAAKKFSSENLNDYYLSGNIYPNWIKKTSRFVYDFTTPEGRKTFVVDAAKGEKKQMFDNAHLAGKISLLTHKPCDIKNLRIGSIKFDDENPDVFTFSKHGMNFRYNIQNGKLSSFEKEGYKRTWSKKPYWKNFSPDSSHVVYAFKHNLFLMTNADTTAIQLTQDGEKHHSFSSRRDKDSEKKTSASVSWFGDSKKFYKLRQNKRLVEDCWIIKHTGSPRPKLRTYKFPMPGDKYVVQYDLHIFDAEKKEHIIVDISKYPDQKVKIIRADFNKDSQQLFFTRESRTHDKIDLCLVNTETGDVKTIITEECKPYINPQLFSCQILNKGNDIIWWSERTGWGQYYRYNRQGQLLNIITKGEFVACNIKDIDTLGRSLIFEGYGRNKKIDPYYRQYYKVNFDGSGFTQITKGDGYHDISLSKNKKYLIDSYSRVDMAPVNILRDIRGKEIMALERPDTTRLMETGWKHPQRIKLKAADGITDLYGVMYKPFNFDPNKKYPIISNVYPGPQMEQVPRTFSIDENSNHSLAQLGFIVINIGHRGGSIYRHKHYHNFGYGNLRDYALKDDKFAIEQLANRYSFIDINRVGIYGHSGGGFMAATALMTYPNFYKVAVSASGNHDNNIYTQWWNETHHGVKQKEIESVENGKEVTRYEFECKIPTNLELAKNLKGNLMLITGDEDVNVHPANTIRMADALIKANKRFDLFIMPGKDHGLGSKYYLKLIQYYFADHLLNDRQNNIDI